jgi:hypothetical protein
MGKTKLNGIVIVRPLKYPEQVVLLKVCIGYLVCMQQKFEFGHMWKNNTKASFVKMEEMQ